MLDGVSILVADDEEIMREILYSLLTREGCHVRMTNDGETAVQVVREEPFDAVLLDIMMPRMSGFEVCQKVKSNPQTRHVAVVMVTALNEVVDYERAVECGTNDFITKPVNKVELLTRVRSQLAFALMRRKLGSEPPIQRRASLDGHSEPLDLSDAE